LPSQKRRISVDKFKGILAKAGWVVALIMAAYLAVAEYIEQNPMPASTAVEQVSQ
jgi:hypothetical protein